MAATFEYLIDAIYESLTTLTSKTRALEHGELFVRGYPPGFPNDLRATRARDEHRRGAVFVAIDQIRPLTGDPDEIGSPHYYTIRVVVSRDYHVAPGWEFDEVRRAMVRIGDDFMRIREALCWPGVLTTDSAGNATGCNSLAAEGAESRIRVERVGDTNDRLLNATDVFQALFSKTP